MSSRTQSLHTHELPNRLLWLEWAFGLLFCYIGVLFLFLSPQHIHPTTVTSLTDVGLTDAAAGVLSFLLGGLVLSYHWHHSMVLRNITNVVISALWIGYNCKVQYVFFKESGYFTVLFPTIFFALALLYVSVPIWVSRTPTTEEQAHATPSNAGHL